MNIDYVEAGYIVACVLSGKLTKEALSQRIGRALKKSDRSLYLTLKLAQADIRFKEDL